MDTINLGRLPRASFITVSIVCLFSLVVLASDSIQWNQIGPGTGGNIIGVSVSPADPNIVLAGSDVGGIYRSGDGGQTWSLRNNALVDPSRFASYGIFEHFAFDPANANIVYFGPLKSTDSGQTWNIKIDENNITAGGGVVEHANGLNNVYVWGYANVYRSSDGFESMSCDGRPEGGNVCAPGGTSCSQDPKSRCYQQSCLPSPGTGDTSGYGCVNTNDSIHEIVLDPNTPGHLLACAESGIYQSTDGAQSWSQIVNPTFLRSVCSGGTSAGHPCLSNTDCPGGGTCPSILDSVCSGGTSAGHPCMSDLDCPGGTCPATPTGVCSGTCTGGGNVGSRCYMNSECPGSTCSTGVVSASACQSNSQCGTGGVCNNPQCVSLTLYAPDTLFMVVKTNPFYLRDAPSSGAWVDIDSSWRGGLYKSKDWGVTWVRLNGTDGTNILPNSSFQTAGDATHPAASWSSEPVGDPHVMLETMFSHSGGSSIKFTSSVGIYSDPRIAVQGGQLYKISAWFYAQSTTGMSASASLSYSATSNGTQPIHWPGTPNWATVESLLYTGDSMYGWRRFEALVRPPDAPPPALPDATIYALVRFGVGIGSGTVYVDDVSLAPAHSLPKISGAGQQPHFVSYNEVVVDPTSVDTLYMATRSGTYLDVYPNNEVGGLWKSTDGGTNWTHLTRHYWHDNVQDGGQTEPICGDGVCGGRWENCNTCPQDCTGSGKPSAPACCGDNVCYVGPDPNNPVENYDNCLADCPFDPDPNPRTYYEADKFIDPATNYSYGAPNGYAYYGVWSLGIGSGPSGHNTLYFGAEHVKSTDGGQTWTDVSSKEYSGPDDPQGGVRQAPGAQDGVDTLDVISDTRVAGRKWLFYGDVDNRLQMSYNDGQSYATEGWQWSGETTNDPAFVSPHVGGDAASSIVLDTDKDGTGQYLHPNRVYVGVAAEGADFQELDLTGTCCHGIVQGDFTAGAPPAVGHWTWTALGDQSTIPPGPGGIELLRIPVGDFLAAIFSRGIYKHVGGGTSGPWTCLGGSDPACPNANWQTQGQQVIPAGWRTYLIRQEPSSGRLYISAGDPTSPVQPPTGETGVWESNNGGTNWCRISNPSSDPVDPNSMDREPVTDMLLLGPNTMLVSTWYAHSPSNPDGSNNDGGLYRGTRNGDCNWTWTRVISQRNVTGITVSGADNSIVYAYVGQVCCSVDIPGQNAGIYKSLDGGNTWPSGPLPNNGLMNLEFGHLYNHSADFKRLYASTDGDGVFEGTVTCTDPVRDFECAARVNPSAQTVTTGSVSAGGLADIASASPDDAYESLLEGTLSGKKRLNATWTFTGAAAGVSYRLRAEGLKVAGGGGAADDFNFSVATRTSGNCTGTESYGSTVITLNGTTDTDTTKEGSAGILPTGSTVFCVKVGDSITSSDSQADTLSIDRLYLMPLQASVATAEAAGGFGTLLSGTYVDTQAHDEQPVQATETLKEGLVGNTSSLLWNYTFTVPLGSTHKLHFEGSRPNNPDGDNFKFAWATSLSGPFTDIPPAVISSPTEITGGTDSGTFGPANFSGTLYIQVKDTNSQSNKNSLDTVSIDHLAVLTVP